MQAIGVLPGVSRSGSTIAGALTCGLDRKSAADFSFLMSIPAILGGLVLEFLKLVKNPQALESIMTLPYWGAMLIAMLAAAISGYFAVRFMIRLVTKKGLLGFAIYTGVLGVVVILLQVFRLMGFGFTPFGG
ncbi:MAG: undecaprenyl-diphosphate phosphatase, partial [Clostridia bacterium]|nr:undecaprenyl-diphosphate phosphatase [Clostridia bacterium]